VSIRRANSTTPFITYNEPERSVWPDDNPAFTFGGLPSDEEVGPEDTMLVNKYCVRYHFNFRTTNVSTAHSPLLGWTKYTPVLYTLRLASELQAQGSKTNWGNYDVSEGE
jgi:hypothetical protein